MGGMDSRRLLYCGAPPAIHLPLLTRLSVARSISANSVSCCSQSLLFQSIQQSQSFQVLVHLFFSRIIGLVLNCRLFLLRTFKLGAECGRLFSRSGSSSCKIMSQIFGADRRVVVSTDRISKEEQAVPTKAGDQVRAMHQWQQRPGCSARKRRTWRL